jgi:ribosomal protein S4E
MKKIKEIRKAEKVFVRFEVVTLEDANNNDIEITQDDCFVVGYEDEFGEECHEDGTYFLQ